MNWLNVLIKALPSIVSLISLAERWFSDKPKSGATKKEFVMESAEAIIGGIESVSTGGQAETWKKIKGPMSSIIDGAAEIAFPHTDIGEPG